MSAMPGSSGVNAAPEAPGSPRAVRIEARSLAHRFGARVALEPQTFTIERGIVAVTGPNGSGKSTLLRIVAGLLRPSEGECIVTVEGREVPPAARRLHAGLVSPELSFYEELSVIENLTFAAEARGLSAPGSAARAALERGGLAMRSADRAGALSSGLVQRLRLAFAALGKPPLLLLDEPGSHLDEDGRARLESWIREAAREGVVLLATNDEREWRLAERCIQLRGRDLGHPS
jgi:ABC-type multidrug transport system ATPase subunit